MTSPSSTFVGIGVAENSLGVAALFQGKHRTFSHGAKERSRLLEDLPKPGACLSAVEAAG